MKFTDLAGKKRNGIKIKCKYCGKVFITRKDQPHIYCSRQCQHSQYSLEHNIEVSCAWCKNKFTKRLSKLKTKNKSGLYFCCRKCKDEAQRLGGIKEIMPDHYGTGNGKYGYRKSFDDSQLVCFRCGYKEFEGSVVIHHIDKNRDNNDKKNLLPLCWNCHRALHNNKWKLINGVCAN